MPKFKVRKYDTFIEYYPDSNQAKHCFSEGSIVEIDDISKCSQAHKLEPISEEEIKKAETVAANPVAPVALAQDDLFVDPLEMNTGSQGKVEIEKAKLKLKEGGK